MLIAALAGVLFALAPPPPAPPLADGLPNNFWALIAEADFRAQYQIPPEADIKSVCVGIRLVGAITNKQTMAAIADHYKSLRRRAPDLSDMWFDKEAVVVGGSFTAPTLTCNPDGTWEMRPQPPLPEHR